MDIADTGLLQTFLEGFFFKLRVMSGMGETANVGQDFDPVFAQPRNEILDWERRMPDGKNGFIHAVILSCGSRLRRV